MVDDEGAGRAEPPVDPVPPEAPPSDAVAEAPGATSPVPPPASEPPPPPPQSGPPQSGPAPAAATSRSISPAQIVIVLGALGIVVSMFLHWIDFDLSVSGQSVSLTQGAGDVPLEFLWDQHASGDPSILILLIPAAALGVIGAVIRQKVLAFVGSIATLVATALYVYQLNDRVDELASTTSSTSGLSLGDFIGIAPYVCGIGAVIMLVGAFMLSGSPKPSPAPDA